jgi:hypothetical protein
MDILFVHGTGVRQPAYDRCLETIAAQLAKALAGYGLLPCYWGETEGCRLRANGASIPEYDTARAIGAVEEEELDIARWRLLYEDPDSEIDAFLGVPGEDGEFVPGTESLLDRVITMLNIKSERTEQLADALQLDSVWDKAHGKLIKYLNAAADSGRSIPELDAEFRAALARALVAHALVLRQSGGGEDPSPTGADRDALIESVFNDWGGSERGLVQGAASWIKDRIQRVALNLGTSKIARKRGLLSDAAYPGAGDILLYQARGEGIRCFIKAKIDSASRPLVVIAHSLGGIACVDLLASKELRNVTMLITVGSQAPLLYELNALWSLPFGQHLPNHFPEWMNIYDKHDFLSYVGEGLFPNRVKDVLVNNGQPFPESHGAYWTNAEVWKAILGKIK